jgi:branched-chain amino acid transport system substrate-binding protein
MAHRRALAAARPRAVLAIATAGALLTLAACGSSSSPATSSSSAAGGGGSSAAGGGGSLPATITIGSPLDTSGSVGVATVGSDEQKGEEFATDEINSSGFLGGNTKINLKVVDTQAAKEQAVQAVISMTKQDPVDAIVGFTLSPSFLAAGPMAQTAKMPTLAVGLSGDGVTEVGDYIFRTYPALSVLYQKTDPEILKAFGAKKVAYLHTSDSSNIVGQYEFRKKENEAAGLQTVADESVTSDAISYTAQLTNIKNASPDVLVVDINGGQDPTFLAQLQQTGLKIYMMTDLGFQAPAVVSTPAAQCATFATTWDVSSTAPKNADFVKNWTAKYGSAPSQYAAWGYEAMYLMATAFKNAGTTDKAKVRDALAGIKNFSGVLGTYDMGPDRTPTSAGIVLQIQNGKTVPWTADTKCTL